MGSGGSKSVSNVKIDTSLAVEALAKNVMNCTSNTKILQSFIISGDYNVIKNSKQVQALKFNQECKQSAQNIADLQQTIANAINNSASAQGSGVLSALGASSSEANTNILNNIKQSITQETIQNIVNTSAAQQELIISGNNNIVDNFEQTQTLDIVLKNCQEVINNLKVIQDLNNKISQDSTAITKNPIAEVIDSVGSIFTSFGMMGVIVIIACIIGVVMIGPGPIMAFLGMSNESESGSENEEYTYSNDQQLLNPPYIPLNQSYNPLNPSYNINTTSYNPSNLSYNPSNPSYNSTGSPSNESNLQSINYNSQSINESY